MRWGRILLPAVLLEVAITALVAPFGVIFGNPLNDSPNGPANTTPYFVAAALGCAGFGFLFGIFGSAKASSNFALHGLLVGVVATILYIGLCSLAPGGLAAVVTAYGLHMYLLLNILRILGCWSGGAYLGAKRQRA
jgi:hypothetical protein